ncbi:MAG TPA: 50S ribosomal protein L22 [Elusimicrobiota bacterium]|jgi:large subunit ribosomal protein L22|nr:50S ribosomal protein L22 [Elusimicrobiota bacterium]
MSTLETQEVRAVAKWVHMSPRKARLVTRHISGRSVPEARTVLAFTQRAAAREIEKVLRSAVANAEANHGLNGDNLVVSAAYVDEGPVMKRWRARARGRVARIKKPTCHITVKLTPAEGAITHTHAPTAAAVPPTPAPEPEALPADESQPEAEAQTVEESEREAEPETDEESKQGPEPEAQAEVAEEPKPKRTPRKKTEETEDE